ncbi:MAG: ABC transporter ATP-binding protein [Desulfatiglans sp.]|nr:ABC transporter ATP-binding protein [Desulfatiglans sp.]
MIAIRELNIDLRSFQMRDINIDIAENEFFILMGPTGAGKTVLLEAIAGLVPIKSGTIYAGEREISGLPPEKRGVSIVYQDYALFPHLKVIDNIIYSLRFRKIDRSSAQKRLARLLDVLNISHLQHRFPMNLSGGEKQRVALARALMVDPDILLLDEPLSSLDPGLREELRHALKKLHQSSQVTLLMVTHDFSEAISLAGRAAVMNNGRIEQVGDVKEIFQKPVSSFVADFVGMKNIFSVSFNRSRALIKDLELELGREVKKPHGYVAIRPEDIVISREKLPSNMRNNFGGTVAKVEHQGFYYEINVQVRDVSFKSMVPKNALIDLSLEKGARAYVSFRASNVHVF